MIEIPEAVSLSKQVVKTLKGKEVTQVIANLSPHKFAWFHGDPRGYDALLRGRTIDDAVAWGGLLEVHAGDVFLLFGDNVNLRFHAKGEKRPPKHQLLLEFDDAAALSASVQMYGGMWCFKKDDYHNPYYEVACSKPSPLSTEFDWPYFNRLIAAPEVQNLSAKALLATEQRIPGLGNGVLQDILFNARIHPKLKVSMLNDAARKRLFQSIKSTLKEMGDQGGRDTEKDLFGRPGGYKTKLSQNTVSSPCPVCGSVIVKQPYMGSIYFCMGCQRI
jgi:formamidopyrimidine-DNA glycosylase